MNVLSTEIEEGELGEWFESDNQNHRSCGESSCRGLFPSSSLHFSSKTNSTIFFASVTNGRKNESEIFWKQTPTTFCNYFAKGWLTITELKPLLTFHSSISTLSNAFWSINNREMKSESGFSLAMASQPLCKILTSKAAFKFCKNATQNNKLKNLHTKKDSKGQFATEWLKR